MKGADLGLAAPMLLERGIALNSSQGKAVLARLPSVAAELLPQVRVLASMMPVRQSLHEGTELEVLERCLSVAWFLYANFCTSSEGGILWHPEGAPTMQPVIDQFVDRTAVRSWLQRKTPRPDAVDGRVRHLVDHLEPSIVVRE